jgi:pectin methylesterase-like acyl-CoA thioesterase
MLHSFSSRWSALLLAFPLLLAACQSQPTQQTQTHQEAAKTPAAPADSAGTKYLSHCLI